MTDTENQPWSGRSDGPVPSGRRYAQREVGDQLAVYDRRNHRAWVQSGAAVRVESMA